MRSRLTQLLTVIGAVTVLVLAANTVAMAATGRGFLLGQTSQTAKLTTLERITQGPALSLQTKNDTAAPFTTNATGKVNNLDADTLDGIDSTKLDAQSLHGVPWYAVMPTDTETELHSTTPATSYRGYVYLSQRATNRVSYNLTLTGASGHTVCQLGTFVNPGEPVTYQNPTTATGTSPSISGFFAFDAGASHYASSLYCTSETPFTVDGIAVTTSTSTYRDYQ